MGEGTDLEKRAIEALQLYREALASAEELEQEEAAARREAFKRLGRFEIAILDDHTSAARPDLVQAGQAAITRLNEVRLALSKATATLDHHRGRQSTLYRPDRFASGDDGTTHTLDGLPKPRVLSRAIHAVPDLWQAADSLLRRTSRASCGIASGVPR